MASGKRDHLVDTALELFYQDGFHATGIDKILENAGVARMTLYNHFKSKDELIFAALRRRDEKFRYWFVSTVERLASKAKDRPLAVFDALEEWFSSDDFSGCMFINAAAEYADEADPIHSVAAEHKKLISNYIRELLIKAEYEGAQELAESLMLLIEGAIVMNYVAGDQKAAANGKRAASILLKN